MMSCKACGQEVLKSKIIMHLKRSKKGCKETYGREFDELKTEQENKRKEYQRKYSQRQNFITTWVFSFRTSNLDHL